MNAIFEICKFLQSYKMEGKAVHLHTVWHFLCFFALSGLTVTEIQIY